MFDPKKLKTNIALILAPDPILRKEASEVKNFDKQLKDYLDDMYYMMQSVDGLGLAGPQANLDMKMFIIDLGIIKEMDKQKDKKELVKNDKSEVKYIINPKITKISNDLVEMDEGCLSLPDVFYKVKRPSTVEIEFQNEKGEKQTMKADGLTARCILHEIDHLEGKIFTDYISKLKQKIVMTKMIKIKNKMLKDSKSEMRIR